MKTFEYKFGTAYSKIPNGNLPNKYKFTADAYNYGCGGYGITLGDNYCKYRIIKVDVPDWVEDGFNSKYHFPLIYPKHISKCGTYDGCFIVCNKPSECVVDYFGEVNQDKMIDDAIASGLTMFYPCEDGSMASIPVTVAK